MFKEFPGKPRSENASWLFDPQKRPAFHALAANFDRDQRLFLNGSLGLTAVPKGVTISDSGLGKAYLEMGQRILQAKKEGLPLITRELLETARWILGGESAVFQKPKLKSGSVIIGKEKNTQIHPEVARRLQDYGYRWEQRMVKKKNKEIPVIVLDYGAEAGVSRNLDLFIQALNERIDRFLNYGEGRVEDLVAFAVQELLIVHPFVDGNGRIARLLGQVLHEILDRQTVIFPREFFEEMSWSHRDLVLKLQESKRQAMLTSSLDRILQNADSEFTAFFETVPIGAWDVYAVDRLKVSAARNVGDAPFGEVLGETQQGKPLRFEGRASSGFLQGRTQPLFFGAPAVSYDEMMGRLRKLFENGRDLRSFSTSRNLNAHVESKSIALMKSGQYGDKSSAFIQTSLSPQVAHTFVNYAYFKGHKFGFILLIDSRGAELLRVGRTGLVSDLEQEVLFDSTLDPRRIYGAYLFYNSQPMGFALNPNYNAQWIQDRSSRLLNPLSPPN